MLSETRTYNLQRLGFKSIAAYRKSELGKKVAAAVYERDDCKCVLCSQPAQTVFMELFDTDVLTGSNLRYSHSLCDICDKALRTDHRGNHIGPVKSNASFRRVLVAKNRQLAVAELHVGLHKAMSRKKKHKKSPEKRNAVRDQYRNFVEGAVVKSRRLARSRQNG